MLRILLAFYVFATTVLVAGFLPFVMIVATILWAAGYTADDLRSTDLAVTAVKYAVFILAAPSVLPGVLLADRLADKVRGK